MSKEFEVVSEPCNEGPSEADGDTVFHEAVDKLLAKLRGHSRGTFGGSIYFRITNAESPDETYSFRLQLQQMNENKECAFCEGTGLQGT